MKTLTPPERRDLRAQAHALHPVVIVGHSGLTAAVLHEIDVSLLAHELIKVRVANDDRVEREAWLARICTELDAAPVQHIGKLLVLYRQRPAKEEDEAPSERRRPQRPSERAAARQPGAKRPTAPAPAGRKPAEPKAARKRLVPSSEREVSAAARRRRHQDVSLPSPHAIPGNRRRSRGRG